MNKLYHSLILLLLLSIGFTAHAGNNDSLKRQIFRDAPEDISHFLFINIIMNPAYTGVSRCETFMIHASIDRPMANFSPFYHPQEYVVTNDFSFTKMKSNAIGVYCTESKDGATEIISPGISYAHCFTLKIGRFGEPIHQLRVGVSLEYNRDSLDLSRLTLGDMIDPRYGFVYLTEEMPPPPAFHYITVNAGLWYSNLYGYFGFTARNLNQPNAGEFSAAVIPMEFNVSAGGRIFIDKHFVLHPSFNANLVKGFKGKQNSYNPALLAAYNEKYFLGISYKDMNKLSVHAGAMIWKILCNAECGYTLNNDISYTGNPVYIGGSIRLILKGHKNRIII